MKSKLLSKATFLAVMFLALSLTAYSVPLVKSHGGTKEVKREYKSLKGVCKCYKQKEYKVPDKHKKFHKSTNR
jgi:hypothetical protein